MISTCGDLCAVIFWLVIIGLIAIPYALFIAAFAFMPVYMACREGPGASGWKFCSFLFCLLAFMKGFFLILPFAALWWAIAWVFSVVAMKSMKKSWAEIDEERRAEVRRNPQITQSVTEAVRRARRERLMTLR